MPLRKRSARIAGQFGAAAIARVSAPAAYIAVTIIPRRPMRSESTPANRIVTASGPVASETARLAASALKPNSRANTGSSAWVE